MNEQYLFLTHSSQSILNSCQSAVSYLNAKQSNTMQQVIKRIRKANMKDAWLKDIGIPVHVTDHTLERWNQRVGPYMSTNKELADYLMIIMSAKVKRYEILEEPNKNFNDYLIEIEKDIVGSFTIKNNSIVFISFFGRVSKVPALANWYFLRHFNMKKGRLNNRIQDQINLDFSIEELQNECLPATPITEWFITGSRTNYVVEKYFIEEQNEPIYVILQSRKGHREWLVINTAKSYSKKLSKRVQQLLRSDGQEEFVEDYLKQQQLNSEKVNQVC
ncbi:hypothetical protein ACMGD3_23885 [Lysinibacillus sphaericus]|uniref:hypothetical protein n=1 Tax=Lysinibacillus sphaericus TaxID=1421 RepID=UPI003F7A93BA